MSSGQFSSPAYDAGNIDATPVSEPKYCQAEPAAPRLDLTSVKKSPFMTEFAQVGFPDKLLPARLQPPL